MTKVVFSKDQNSEYKKFVCKGHAGSGKYGYDIVCSAVSILVINTINSLEELCNLHCEVISDENAGYIECILPGNYDEKSKVLIDALVLGLTSVESQYGKNYCKVEFEEV